MSAAIENQQKDSSPSFSELIVECRKRLSKLTSWEFGWLESVEGWLNSGATMTEKEWERLRKIHSRVTKGESK